MNQPATISKMEDPAEDRMGELTFEPVSSPIIFSKPEPGEIEEQARSERAALVLADQLLKLNDRELEAKMAVADAEQWEGFADFLEVVTNMIEGFEARLTLLKIAQARMFVVAARFESTPRSGRATLRISILRDLRRLSRDEPTRAMAAE